MTGTVAAEAIRQLIDATVGLVCMLIPPAMVYFAAEIAAKLAQ